MFANFKVGYISELTLRGTNLGIGLQLFLSPGLTLKRKGEAGILIAASVVNRLLLLQNLVMEKQIYSCITR